MSEGVVDEEMQRRFEAAEKIEIAETSLRAASLHPTAHSLRAHFEGPVGQAQAPLENPHVEPRVPDAERARATPAAVLLPVVLREPTPTILVTQRHHGISFPGHWVFPGGRMDEGDASPQAAALREAHEEVGLEPDRVEILGRLGDYVSHSGFRIAPVVALVRPPFELSLHPEEVIATEEVPLAHLLDGANYFLFRFQERKERAHFAMRGQRDDVLLTGLTASIAIGLYSELLKTHAAPA